MQVAVTPRGLPDPGAPPEPTKTLSRWNQFLGSVAAGVALPDAMLKHYMTRADIESCVRSDPAERVKWQDARTAALKRSWSEFDFEDVFGEIASGTPIGASCEKFGKDQSAFVKLVIADADLNEQYMRALKSRSLAESEKIIVLADDSSNDVIAGPKGDIPNQAAVNRSKLQVETRTRLMSAWHTKMFGEGKANVQVNVQVNHARTLEEARARSSRRGQPAITAQVVEAAFKDLPPDSPQKTNSESPVDEFAWLDEKPAEAPLDTTWLDM